MWVVRPIRTEDLAALVDLAQSLGPGMTTMPADRAVLAAKIEGSVASFAGRADRASTTYLLVLEDPESGTLLGTAALYPHVGAPYGFFSYKRLKLVQRSQALGIDAEIETLSLANDYTGSTEVGSLAIRPELKGTGAGRLMARSRYMLAATFPDLFAPLLMAEMRGWQDENNRSPFWDAVGARFFNMDFSTADRVSAQRGSDFIAELMPKHPIYVDLLPQEARSVIGKPHRDSAPALAMLRREGFRFEGYVDVFDAGPQVHCDRESVATIRLSRKGPVARLSPSAEPDSPEYLVCNTELDRFRVVLAPGRVAEGEIALSNDVAAALGVMVEDNVRWSPGSLAELA